MTKQNQTTTETNCNGFLFAVTEYFSEFSFNRRVEISPAARPEFLGMVRVEQYTKFNSQGLDEYCPVALSWGSRSISNEREAEMFAAALEIARRYFREWDRDSGALCPVSE